MEDGGSHLEPDAILHSPPSIPVDAPPPHVGGYGRRTCAVVSTLFKSHPFILSGGREKIFFRSDRFAFAVEQKLSRHWGCDALPRELTEWQRSSKCRLTI